MEACPLAASTYHVSAINLLFPRQTKVIGMGSFFDRRCSIVFTSGLRIVDIYASTGAAYAGKDGKHVLSSHLSFRGVC